jgi:hypothetical protein
MLERLSPKDMATVTDDDLRVISESRFLYLPTNIDPSLVSLSDGKFVKLPTQFEQSKGVPVEPAVMPQGQTPQHTQAQSAPRPQQPNIQAQAQAQAQAQVSGQLQQQEQRQRQLESYLQERREMQQTGNQRSEVSTQQQQETISSQQQVQQRERQQRFEEHLKQQRELRNSRQQTTNAQQPPALQPLPQVDKQPGISITQEQPQEQQLRLQQQTHTFDDLFAAADATNKNEFFVSDMGTASIGIRSSSRRSQQQQQLKPRHHFIGISFPVTDSASISVVRTNEMTIKGTISSE